MQTGKLGLLLLGVFGLSVQVYAQCSNASLNGTFFYTLAGSVKSGTTTASYDELGEVVADGNGNFTGSTTTSIAGVIANLPVTGIYSIKANCSGTGTLTTTADVLQLSLQLVSGGGTTLASITSSGVTEIANGRFYRAANSTGSVCGNGTLNGTYGVLLSGGTYAAAVRTAYEAANQTSFDGNGNVTVTGEVTTAGTTSVNWNGTGTYSMAANCSGTAQITSPNGTVNYLLARIAGGTVLFLESDANTTVSGSANAQQLEQVLPQFAFGGGWYSALYFTNTSSIPVTFRVSFTADDGTALNVPGVGTSKQITLNPLATTIIEAQNGGTLIQGYATFSLPVGVNGYGIFRQTVTGRADQEALVGFKSSLATAISLTFDDTTLTSSVAIVNPSSVAANLTITAWDNNGNQLGTYTQTLPPGNKIENTLRALGALSGIVGFRGSALFTVSTGNVSVLGLRFSGSAFTSIPTTQDQ
jgi:hypothetical protein